MAYKLAANGSASLDTSSKIILAAAERRRYALIVNGSDVGVWLSFGQAAVIGAGIYLSPGGGSYEIDSDNAFNGDIYGIASSGSGKVIGTVVFQ